MFFFVFRRQKNPRILPKKQELFFVAVCHENPIGIPIVTETSKKAKPSAGIFAGAEQERPSMLLSCFFLFLLAPVKGLLKNCPLADALGW